MTLRRDSLNLTPFMRRVLDTLRENETATHAQIFKALYGDILIDPEHESNRVKIHIWRLRRAVKPYGVTVISKRTHGYMLTDESRAIIASMMREAA